MFRKAATIALSLILLTGLAACGASDSADTGDKLAVSVTFDALGEFARAVGGDRVSVTVIIPDGTEPHDFEPKARDLVGLSTAGVFVYNGLGMESWAQEAAQAASNADLVVTAASDGITPIENTDAGEATEHGQYDPHVWLSLSGAETEVTNIKNALTAADPAGADYYEQNCAAYLEKLAALYDEYSKKFSAVTNKTFVTGHAAFGYLCRDFGLEQRSVEDVFAEGEPSARQLGELVQYCRDNGVTTIFAEELASPEVSQTLADDVGAQVKTIYTMESAEDGKSYLTRMEDNLAEIYESLSA